MIVDSHAHVLPKSYPAGHDGLPRMEQIEGSDDRTLVFGAMRFLTKDIWFEAERRLEAMDANGVSVEIVSPMPALLRYDLTPADGLALAQYVNDWVVQLCAHAPDRIIGLGIVPMQDPDAATAELAAIKAQGLSGVEIASSVLGSSIGDAKFLPFFREVQRLGLAVFVHAMPAANDRMPASGNASFGVGVEGMYAAASMILGGTAEACPDLRISFSHAAGGLPLLLPRANYFWGAAWNEEPPVPEKAFMHTEGPSPLEYARRFYYDSLVFDARALRFLVDYLGADRLLVGSDFPAMPRENPIAKTLQAIGLQKGQWEDISWRNALRWIGRDAG